jgi:hypothetical protein
MPQNSSAPSPGWPCDACGWVVAAAARLWHLVGADGADAGWDAAFFSSESFAF